MHKWSVTLFVSFLDNELIMGEKSVSSCQKVSFAEAESLFPTILQIQMFLFISGLRESVMQILLHNLFMHTK